MTDGRVLRQIEQEAADRAAAAREAIDRLTRERDSWKQAAENAKAAWLLTREQREMLRGERDEARHFAARSDANAERWERLYNEARAEVERLRAGLREIRTLALRQRQEKLALAVKDREEGREYAAPNRLAAARIFLWAANETGALLGMGGKRETC